MRVSNDDLKVAEYRRCIGDLLKDRDVLSMKGFMQHGRVTCLEHCLAVSFYSYRICRLLRWDYRSAARGGMLHDMFLYDWHTGNPKGGLHAFSHPSVALSNATRRFDLNAIEKDIILKHMWPLTLRFPRYREALVVSLVDKGCAFLETLCFGRLKMRVVSLAPME